MIRIFVSIFIFFSLAVSLQGRGLRVAFVGDPQVDDVTELGYARNSIYKDLQGRKDIDVVVILGDLVNDNPSLLSPSRQILDSLRCPWVAVPGNHDFDVHQDKGRMRDLTTWRQVIGYEDTTFVINDIRFALLNNVAYKARGGYDGEFNVRQMAWLDSLSRVTPSDMHFILATHIPVSGTAQKDSLIKMFDGHEKVLFVSGHTHTVARHTLDDTGRVEELIAGATCGSWWRGGKDSYGIPYALQNCGAPRGYFVTEFSKKNCRHEFYPVLGGPACSASVRVSENGHKMLYVNVFGGHNDGHVEVRIKGLGRFDLTRVEETACEVLNVIAYNKSISREERKSRRSELIPLRRIRSSHLWAVRIPEDLAVKEVKVRYEDRCMMFNTKIQTR